MKNKEKNISAKEEMFLQVNNKTPFAVKEAFALLRTNVVYTNTVTEGAPVFAITSAGEGSGKSTIMSNLVGEFARIEKKVILIDADMRYPVQHRFFGYSKTSIGLSEVLSGIVRDKNEAVIHTENKYLDIIPAGHIPPNPSELFHNTRFGTLICELKKEYDYIFIDFPPIGVVSDPISAVNYVDAYLFVIRANVSNRIGVMESLNELEQVGGHVAGIIMNDVDFKDGMISADKYRGGRYGKYGKYSRYGKYSKYSKYYTDLSNSSKE